MKINSKKRFKSSMSFNAAEFQRLTLGNSGAVLGETKTLADAIAAASEQKERGEQVSEKGLSFVSALRPEVAVPEKVAMKPENTLLAPFRLLSATIVGAGSWKATDFSQNGVLKSSMSKLANKPVYRNHWMYDVSNWLGLVNELSWTESYLQNGVVIPAGIDGILAIDVTSDENAQIGRGIVSGAIRSNSVTVDFEWVKSHDLPDHVFWDVIGTMVDSRMVCRVVTKIIDYHETSIVALGADPFAKAIDASGNLVDIDLSGSQGLETILRPFASDEDRLNFCKQAESVKHYVIDAEKENIVLSMSLSKAKLNLAASFGSVLSSFVESYATDKGIEKSAVVDILATAADLTKKTVEGYLSGTTTCPKMSYLTSWSKALAVDVKSLIKASESEGCAYTKEELKAACGDDDMEDEEGDEYKKDEEKEEDEMEKDKKDDVNMSKDKFQKEIAEFQNAASLAKVEADTLRAELETVRLAARETAANDLVNLAKLRGELEAEKTKVLALVKEKAAMEINRDSLNKVVEDLNLAKERISELELEVEQGKEVQHLTQIGREYLTKMKSEAVRLYRASFGDRANDAVVALFDTANSMETLNGLVEQYGKQLASDFHFCCKKCGSNEYEFGSVIVGSGKENFAPKNTTPSDDDIRRIYKKS